MKKAEKKMNSLKQISLSSKSFPKDMQMRLPRGGGRIQKTKNKSCSLLVPSSVISLLLYMWTMIL